MDLEVIILYSSDFAGLNEIRNDVAMPLPQTPMPLSQRCSEIGQANNLIEFGIPH